IGRTFQRLQVFTRMTVRQNLQVAAEAVGGGGGVVRGLLSRRGSADGDVTATVDGALERLGLGWCANRLAGDLPTGVLRLVELGRALCAAPQILLLDEPVSGLDATETNHLRAVIDELAAQGIGVLLVEHDVGFVLAVAETIYVLDFGRLIASGRPDEIEADPAVRAAYLGSTFAAEITVRVLDGVDLSVPEGGVAVLLGPNGAGKTTTLRVIAGLLPAWEGRILFDGGRLDGCRPYEVSRRGVILVPEGRGVFPALSVRENLEIASRAKAGAGRSDRRQAVDDVLDVFPRLGERLTQAAGTLSGGEQQMLALARGLLARPRLLVIDELSLGLAPQIVEQLFATVAELKARRQTVLLVEQYVTHALHVADVSQLYLGEPASQPSSSR
ncbi:MAG: ATP-binding cassette domain-containing protein, partial [Actinobacteria bacterium]